MILSAGTLASCMLRTKLFLQRWTFASHSVRLPSLSSSQPSSSSSQPSSSRPNRSGQLCGAGHWLHQLRAHLHLPGDRPLHHNGKSDSLRAGIDWNLSRATAGLAQCCKGLWRRMRRWVLLTITIIIINIIIIISYILPHNSSKHDHQSTQIEQRTVSYLVWAHIGHQTPMNKNYNFMTSKELIIPQIVLTFIFSDFYICRCQPWIFHNFCFSWKSSKLDATPPNSHALSNTYARPHNFPKHTPGHITFQ